MGAVTFSIDIRLVECLKSVLPISGFVETGTFNGDTIVDISPYFDKLITIEFSKQLWEKAITRFKNERNVEAFHGNSPEVLEKIRPRLTCGSWLFWLDAHWCVAENTVGNHSQCPLLEEIVAIRTLGAESVVLIDDARLFLAPPPAPHDISQWPSFDQITAALHGISDMHELMVVNDVIAFYPKSISWAMIKYAQEYGVDWLAVSPYLDPRNNLLESLDAKERIIQSQHTLLQQQRTQLEEKERLLEEVRVMSFVFRPFLRPLLWALRPTYLHLKPKLGILRQHPPCALCLPAHYNKNSRLAVTPRISIVTPSFKQSEFIEYTIKSVLDQYYPNLEFYVQDGGSEDGTTDVLRYYEHRLNGWESCRDSGQANAINIGFAKTSGEIMAWLNSDDILLPGSLAYVADYFSCHPEVDVVYGHRILINESNQQIGRWMMPVHDNQILSWADFIPQETLFWRRRIWEKVGAKIDESFHFAIDWDLLVRFREAGARFARLPRFLGGFRIHPQQKTSAELSEIGVEEMNRIRKRILGRVPSRSEINKAIYPYLLKHILTDLNWNILRSLGFGKTP